MRCDVGNNAKTLCGGFSGCTLAGRIFDPPAARGLPIPHIWLSVTIMAWLICLMALLGAGTGGDPSARTLYDFYSQGGLASERMGPGSCHGSRIMAISGRSLLVQPEIPFRYRFGGNPFFGATRVFFYSVPGPVLRFSEGRDCSSTVPTNIFYGWRDLPQLTGLTLAQPHHKEPLPKLHGRVH